MKIVLFVDFDVFYGRKYLVRAEGPSGSTPEAEIPQTSPLSPLFKDQKIVSSNGVHSKTLP